MNAPINFVPCRYCRQTLKLDKAEGWVHLSTGSEHCDTLATPSAVFLSDGDTNAIVAAGLPLNAAMNHNGLMVRPDIPDFVRTLQVIANHRATQEAVND